MLVCKLKLARTVVGNAQIFLAVLSIKTIVDLLVNLLEITWDQKCNGQRAWSRWTQNNEIVYFFLSPVAAKEQADVATTTALDANEVSTETQPSNVTPTITFATTMLHTVPSKLPLPPPMSPLVKAYRNKETSAYAPMMHRELNSSLCIFIEPRKARTGADMPSTDLRASSKHA